MVLNHTDHIQKTIASNAPALCVAAASWRRCIHAYGLDPDDVPPVRRLANSELQSAMEQSDSLLSAAQPELDSLGKALGPFAVCVLFSDANGTVLSWRGSNADRAELREWGLWPGANWSERSGGTNGIGTCLVEKRLLHVHADQHFYAHGPKISCIAAPIFDAQGSVSGALNATVYGDDTEPLWAGLMRSAVQKAAAQIETRHFHLSFPHARTVAVGGIKDSTALIAVDRDDVILGATHGARKALGLTSVQINHGLCVDDLMSELGDGLVQAEHGVLRRALIRERGNVTGAAKVLGISRATMKRKINLHALRRKP